MARMNHMQRWRNRAASSPGDAVVGGGRSAREALEALRAAGRDDDAQQLEAAMRSGNVEAVRSLLARV